MNIDQKMKVMAPIFAKHADAVRNRAKTTQGLCAVLGEAETDRLDFAIEKIAKRNAVAEFNATYP